MALELEVEGEGAPTDHIADTGKMVAPEPAQPVVAVPLDPLFLEWLHARASAYGETVEAHAGRLIREKWQTDTWRLKQQGGGMAGPRGAQG